MFKSLARSAVLGAGVAAAGMVALVAGAFAFYYLLRDPLTPAGAAALTAVLFLIIAGVLAMVMRGGGGGGGHSTASSGPPALGGSALPQKAMEFAKQRPLIAGAVGVFGALYLLRNPALLTGLIGLAAGRAEGKQEVRRGFF
jgi:hypothetical protein